MSFIPMPAATVAISSSGTQIHAALASDSNDPSACGTPCTPRKVKMGRKITSGAINCITLTPRLPRPPLMPSALPCFALGKKKLILPMLEAKLAPANPHISAMIINTPNGVAVFCTAKPSQTQGITRMTVLKMVQRRPPNIGTIKE